MFSGLLQKLLWANNWERRESFSKFVEMQVIWPFLATFHSRVKHVFYCFDPYEIENVKQKNSSNCSNLICCRGQVQRPFSCDSLAVRRILVLLITSNEPNEHHQLGQCIVNGRTAQWHQLSCKLFDIFLNYGILLNGSVDLIRVLLSFQCTKALSDLTRKLGPNVDGAACVFGLSRKAYQRHFRG